MDIQLIKEIRTQTGASFGDCKKALEQANGDLNEAVKIASNMFQKQQDEEKEEANSQTQEAAINLLKSEFDKLTEIISDKNDLNRWRNAAEHIIEKYELELSEEQKKRLYITSTLLTPLESVPKDIKSEFIATYNEQKMDLQNSTNSLEIKNLETKIQNVIKKQLQKYGEIDGQIDCLRFDPMLFSTTVDLTKGYNILSTDCKGISEVVETLLSDAWYDGDIVRYSENGTDLNQLFDESNGTLNLENESPDGASAYYVTTAAMKSLADGPFEEYGFKGLWEEVDTQELYKLTTLKSEANSASSDNTYLEIIELFIKKIQ
ncbi:MAG: hypothetical protein VXY91_06205 [Bacteroidota bacterium]|nr:hypothetical protein [Bacteroidota bacterium]